MTAESTVDPRQTHVARQWKHTAPLINCRFDPTGKYLFATSEDATVQRWEASGEGNVTLKGHTSWVRGMAFRRTVNSW